MSEMIPYEVVMAGFETVTLTAMGPSITAGHGDSNGSNRSCDKHKESNKTKTKSHQQVKRHADTENVIDDMLRIIKENEKQIAELKERNEKAEQRIRDIERRSNEITSGMAKMTDMKGSFENINDEFANSKITETFYRLYDNDWVQISRCLGKHLDLPELELIHHLTGLMRFGYEECLRSANSQIRQMFLLNENDLNPTQNQHQELFAVRRQYARTKEVRNRLIHAVWEELIKMENTSILIRGKNGLQAGKLLQNFFNKYIDCCWLMVVSNPPVMLHFDVIGTPYTDCSEYFRIYSLKKPVIDSTKEEGTICEVVWPSVCLQDGSACYKKGDVVIVKVGKKARSPVNNQSKEAVRSQSDYTLHETPMSSSTDATVRQEKESRQSDV